MFGGDIEPIVQRHVDKLTKLFTDLRDDFNRLSRLSQVSADYDRSFAIDSSPLNRQAEQTFIQNLAINDLRQLLDAETLKRSHCERKIDMLHKRGLHLEQRLAIVETHATAQNRCLDQVENDVRELLTELAVSEENRIVKCQQLIDENVSFRKELDEYSILNESLHRQIGQLESRIDDMNTALQTERLQVDMLKNQLEILKNEVDQLKKDKQDLQNDNRRIDNNYKAACEREKELNIEMLSLQNAHSKCEMTKARLEAAINSEKSLAKQHLQQKQHEYEKNADEIRRDMNLQLTSTIDEMRRKHEDELVRINDTCETALKQAANQTEMLRRERDKLAMRLADIEGDLNHRQQQISADMQHKLAAKYQELLSEFAPYGNHGASSALTGTSSRSTNFNRNMAQEFLDNLRETRPILAVDNDSFNNVNGGKMNPPSERRHQLQGLLRQAIPPPSESAFRNQHHNQRAPPPPHH